MEGRMKSLLTWNMQKYGFLSIEEQTEGAKSRKKWLTPFSWLHLFGGDIRLGMLEIRGVKRFCWGGAGGGKRWRRVARDVHWIFHYSQKEMVWESIERKLKLDWAFTLSRFEGVAINEHFLLKARFSTLRGEAWASTQHGWSLICKIPSKGVIVRSCYDSHCIKWL